MDGLTLAQADALVQATLAAAQRRSLKPLAVAVLDAGGHLVMLKRQDGASFLRPQIAIAKAWTALGLQAPSRGFHEMAEARPGFAASLYAISDGRMAPAAGGLLIRRGGADIGAIGVIGDT
ncbi:MAG: heme-binding protein, partial [Caulobacterales bacterium]|nr:heme-binding protein [Caulobacterales bacterium]